VPMIDFYLTHLLTHSCKSPVKNSHRWKKYKSFVCQSAHQVHEKYTQQFNGNTANFNQPWPCKYWSDLKNSKCFEIRMMRSLCLWNFMNFTHGQIYSSGSLDMEWPLSLTYKQWNKLFTNPLTYKMTEIGKATATDRDLEVAWEENW